MNASMIVPGGASVPLSVTSPENLFGGGVTADASNTAPDNIMVEKRINTPIDLVLLIPTFILVTCLYHFCEIDEFEIKK